VTRYRVLGMDCAKDAAEIESAVRAIEGAGLARVSLASHVLAVPAVLDAQQRARVERSLEELGYRVEPLDGTDATDLAAPHQSAGYRRALWIVVLLNLGYGIIEGVGGFLAGSQAVKADALDFLGDGLITGLGLIAIHWSTSWRARAALLQGAFLGLLGTAVVLNTVYRVFVQQQPHSEAMGLLAAGALVVNLVSAAVLLPHRTGDANVRAVWLFSRNDAIGNVAVLGAAGLVAVTGTPWPDLVVAFIVAALFLHSSRAIITDARTDLSESAAAPSEQMSSPV
jgi:Co/Zn/Cd efflux system component/copper chaperone CopZ